MRKNILLIFCFVFCVEVCAMAQTISTIAGGMMVGYSGDGEQASSALLSSPQGITVDAVGNIYFADEYNNCVRMISASGIITTIAGNGTAGYFGDGGPATLANLDMPAAVAVDGNSNIYIAEYQNHCVRQINATTGIITTFAGNGTPGSTGDGGPATSCELWWPVAVATDKAGNVYIADDKTASIRKVNAMGIITTVAGNGMRGFSGDGGPATIATLRNPYGIAVDATGNLYIADQGNQCIRKIDITGNISTFAGNHFSAGTGFGGYSGDGGSATAAELNLPRHIGLDNSSNLYISDFANQRVRKVDAQTGIITTVAGDGVPGYNGDGPSASSRELYYPDGVAADNSGNLYIADRDNNRIRCVSSTLSVNKINNTNKTIEVYPNPTSKNLIITSGDYLRSIAITNLFGQTLFSHEYNTEKVQVDVAALIAGVYLIRINGTEVRKFVKE